MPSKTQISPKEMRMSRRATGSAWGTGHDNAPPTAPEVRARWSWAERNTFQATATRASSNRTMRPWLSSAAWKADTTAGLLVLRPLFMPDMLR